MLSLLNSLLAATAFVGNFEVTLLHTNDLHSHAEPVMIRGKSYGGYARQATLINQARKLDKNLLLLNGGDTFQGTLYFNVYEGLSDLAFMNQVGYQAAAVGNHEFDRGPKTFSEFVKRANFPLLAANLDVSNDPDLKDRIKAWTILNVGKEKVGVIGAVTPDLPTISDIGQHVKMKELFASISQAVSELKVAKISKIFLVSHCGYELEREIVAKIPEIDVVVGGHSHSFLANPSFPKLDGWPTPLGPYPTIVNHVGGSRSLVLQGWEWGKILGNIKIQFDSRGQVSGWRDALPIVVDDKIPDDPTVANLIAAFQKPIIATMLQKIGKTEVNLDRNGLMRELLPDAMQEAAKAFGAVASFMNTGGVRSGIDAGDITLGKLNEVQPFRNTLMILELSGQELKDALETPALGTEISGGMLLPSSGTSYFIDMSRPSGQRVANIVVGGSPIQLGKTYRLALNNFTAGGGDAHTVLKIAKGYRYDTGLLDIDILVDYVKANSPITRVAENRVRLQANR